MARIKDTGPNPETAMLPVAGKKTTRASRAKSAAMNGMPAHTNESVKVKNTEVEVEENEMDHATGVKPARSAKNTGEVKVGKSAKAVKGDEKKSVAPSGDESVSKQTTKGKKTKAADTKPAEANGKKVHKNFNESGKEIPTEKKAEASNAKEDIKWDSNKNGKRNSDAITGNEDNMMSKKPKKAQTQATTEKQSKRVPAKASKIAKNSTLAKESKVTKNLKTAKSVEGKSGNKKRKQSDDEDSTDASSDSGMVKKLKTSVKQGGSEILNKVKATLETVTNAVSGGQTSIIDDIADLAKDATQSNPKGNKSSTKGQKSAKSAVEPTEAETKAKNDSVADDVSAEDGDGDHWEPEDEVAQLITGFESASEDEESGDEGFKQGKAIPKLSKQVTLVLEEQMGNKSDGPGVIYVGRVPHGFHEHEMRAYFSQFGDVKHVRLSRSKKTGRSKHYAFLEFKSEEVAKIAAKTMDKYLLFGHILRCSFVPQEQIHSSLWNGADKRFKNVPWAKIEGRKLSAPKGRSQWQKMVEKESKHRTTQANKLKEIGYEFEPVELKTVDSVPIQATKEVENVIIQEEQTVVAVKLGNDIVVSEEMKSKKVKKVKELTKAHEDVVPANEVRSSSEEGKRIKRPSKRALEAAEAAEAIPEVKKTRRTKKK